jgi:CheY-like chemotaxis protein
VGKEAQGSRLKTEKELKAQGHRSTVSLEDSKLNGKDSDELSASSFQPSARAKRVPIIALTASVFEEDKDKVLAGGCDDFVRKPFQVDEIFAKMAQYLGVRYIYRDLQTPKEKPVAAALTSADLAGLPEDLVQQINTAAKGAMSKKLLDLLQQIPPDYIHVTDAMVDLISQNQFSKIIALTEKENKDD